MQMDHFYDRTEIEKSLKDMDAIFELLDSVRVKYNDKELSTARKRASRALEDFGTILTHRLTDLPKPFKLEVV